MAKPPRVIWITWAQARHEAGQMCGVIMWDIEDPMFEAVKAGQIRVRVDGLDVVPAWWGDDATYSDLSRDAVLEVHRGDLHRWCGGGIDTSGARGPGAPPKWDWDDFWVAACLLANTPDGLPETQAQFVERMQQWFMDRHGDHPADSTLKAKAGKLYKALVAGN